MAPPRVRPQTASGKEFESIMSDAELSQSDVAEIFGCDLRTVRRYISGELVAPQTALMLLKVFALFDIDPDELLLPVRHGAKKRPPKKE